MTHYNLAMMTGGQTRRMQPPSGEKLDDMLTHFGTNHDLTDMQNGSSGKQCVTQYKLY